MTLLERNEEFLTHMTELLLKVEEEFDSEVPPERLFREFERISVALKHERAMRGEEPQQAAKKANMVKPFSAPVNPFRNYYQRVKNINSNVLWPAGKGISQIEADFIQKELDAKATALGGQFAFLGKVQAIAGDYFVIYGCEEFSANQAPTAARPFDPLSSQIDMLELNRVSFHVASATTDFKWKELPAISAAKVRKARQVKVVLTGNLDSKIDSPEFDGKEEELLHAQLLRIVSSCALVPKVVYKIAETDGPEVPESLKQVIIDSEFKGLKLDVEEVGSPATWAFLFPCLLRSGHVYHFVEPSGRNEEQMTEAKDKLSEFEAIQPRLREMTPELFKSWRKRVLGPKGRLSTEEEGLGSLEVLVFESTVWPGAFNLFSFEHQNWFFGYFGNAIKCDSGILPKTLLKTEKEARERREQPEPNFEPDPPAEPAQDGDQAEGGERNPDEKEKDGNKGGDEDEPAENHLEDEEAD